VKTKKSVEASQEVFLPYKKGIFKYKGNIYRINKSEFKGVNRPSYALYEIGLDNKAKWLSGLFISGNQLSGDIKVDNVRRFFKMTPTDKGLECSELLEVLDTKIVDRFDIDL